jgi:hypothetical protein
MSSGFKIAPQNVIYFFVAYLMKQSKEGVGVFRKNINLLCFMRYATKKYMTFCGAILKPLDMFA